MQQQSTREAAQARLQAIHAQLYNLGLQKDDLETEAKGLVAFISLAAREDQERAAQVAELDTVAGAAPETVEAPKTAEKPADKPQPAVKEAK